jgi:glycosyltransferase involved in cell wall biosynthesis
MLTSAALRGFLAGRPLAAAPYFNEALASKLRQVVSSRAVDVVQIEHTFMAAYARELPADARRKTILSLHNVGARQYRTMLRMKASPQEHVFHLVMWLSMLRREARYAQSFDHCLVVSPSELRHMQALNPDITLSLIENGIDTSLLQPPPDAAEGNDLLFVGYMRYLPNLDAVTYFCDAILPLIKQRIPDASLAVVGNTQGADIRRLQGLKDVRIVGKVDDVSPFYRNSRIAVVPLRAGGGTRLKILEAMALGRPVVTTSLGCEGLAVEDGTHLMIADTADEFAACVVRLLSDRSFCNRLAKNARELVESRYDWSVIGRKLISIYEHLHEPVEVGMGVGGRAE